MNACLKQTLEEREARKDEVGEVLQGPCSVPLSLICLLRVCVSGPPPCLAPIIWPPKTIKALNFPLEPLDRLTFSKCFPKCKERKKLEIIIEKLSH